MHSCSHEMFHTESERESERAKFEKNPATMTPRRRRRRQRRLRSCVSDERIANAKRACAYAYACLGLPACLPTEPLIVASRLPRQKHSKVRVHIYTHAHTFMHGMCMLHVPSAIRHTVYTQHTTRIPIDNDDDDDDRRGRETSRASKNARTHANIRNHSHR